MDAPNNPVTTCGTMHCTRLEATNRPEQFAAIFNAPDFPKPRISVRSIHTGTKRTKSEERRILAKPFTSLSLATAVKTDFRTRLANAAAPS
jgi:hypothetical protein